jgi:hypothetical protein
VRSLALFSPSVPPSVTRFVYSQTGEREAGGGKLTVPEVLVQASVMAQTGFAIRPGMPFATHRLAATIAHLKKAWGRLALARPARAEFALHSLQDGRELVLLALASSAITRLG